MTEKPKGLPTHRLAAVRLTNALLAAAPETFTPGPTAPPTPEPTPAPEDPNGAH